MDVQDPGELTFKWWAGIWYMINSSFFPWDSTELGQLGIILGKSYKYFLPTASLLLQG